MYLSSLSNILDKFNTLCDVVVHQGGSFLGVPDLRKEDMVGRDFKEAFNEEIKSTRKKVDGQV